MDDSFSIRWPAENYTRVPNRLYHDLAIYEREQARIFRGRVWAFIGLDAEIPNVGDFRTSWVGDTPVVYNRSDDGRIHVFVNRCAHRSAMLRRETSGNASEHTCVYHRWCYDLSGNLIGVPFRHGVAGAGGLADDFDLADHGLHRLRVESFCGVIFATFADDIEPLADYLGVVGDHLARTLKGPLRVLGHQRQRIRGNWKLYAENVRDQYHGSLLHEFQGTFISRITTAGGSKLDPRHGHNVIFSLPWTEAEDQDAEHGKADVVHAQKQLLDQTFLETFNEYDDGYGSTICSFFPNATFQQIRNSLATRQIRTKGVDELELFWTIFGFESDDDKMTLHRLRQTNMAGPAGYVSAEDGEAVEIVHRATKDMSDVHSIVEMGGRGPIPEKIDTRINDVAIRGFWSAYSTLMDAGPAEAGR